MGKKGDIDDWEDMAKKWLELIYKLIEKPEKKEFEETLKLVTKTRKLLSEMEYPINQNLVNDLRMQLSAVINAGKYVLENVPKGNYYMVMPDFITHMSRVVLLISKVIQNIWSSKHGIAFEYVPPEASVYIPAQTDFFRTEMKGEQTRISAPTQVPTGRVSTRSASVGYGYGYAYNPHYIYSRAYKYAYWRPRSRDGNRLYLAGLLTFLPTLLGYMKQKSSRGGLSPSDVNLIRTIFSRIKEVANQVTLEGINLEPIKEFADRVLESVRGFDIEEIQRKLAPLIEQAETTISPIVESSKVWLDQNVPKIVESVRNAIERGELGAVDINDIQNAVKNVAMLAGDQIKELPKLAEQASNELNVLLKEAMPVVQEATTVAMREASNIIQNFPTMIGAVGKSLESVDLTQLTKSMQDIAVNTDEMIKAAADNLGKLFKSFFG